MLTERRSSGQAPAEASEAGIGRAATTGAAIGLLGEWTQPFEEGGAGVPRCVPAEDGTDFVVCKPTAQATAVLPDGRVFYYNGLEAWENARGSSFTSASPSSRNSQARVLDLRSGTPEFPSPPRPAADSPTPTSARVSGLLTTRPGWRGFPAAPVTGWWARPGAPSAGRSKTRRLLPTTPRPTTVTCSAPTSCP